MFPPTQVDWEVALLAQRLPNQRTVEGGMIINDIAGGGVLYAVDADHQLLREADRAPSKVPQWG